MAQSFKSKKEKLDKQMRPKLEKEIYKLFDKYRNQGILIGWNAFAIQAIKNIENMATVDEIKTYLKSEAEKTEKKLNINLNEIE